MPPDPVPISRLCGSLGGALVEPWGSLGVALCCLVYGFVVALWWLCTPESMPSSLSGLSEGIFQRD